MPVGLSRLRIAGFKSFAEPQVLEIPPGLTGIVGPNGCGKSNVVEALRWAMGESSAKSLRGGEMDDVIFAGTTHRPSRNLADVTITLEAADAGFPPPFAGQAELEVTRRIERGSGSSYRVNGREARARDVQTLFADLASGARGSAIVSQGRVGTLVNARPEDRRALLEEASGIGGLAARRHEAELKLRQAEANAARAEDLRCQLAAQSAGLQKQAKQAARYRNLSGLIRTAEAEYLAVQHARATEARRLAAATLHQAREAAAEAATAAEAARARAAANAADLPGLRAAEAEARTALERAKIGLEQAADAQKSARNALAEAKFRVERLHRDRAHGVTLVQDAAAALARLAAEQAGLAQTSAHHPTRLAEAEAAHRAATSARAQADAALAVATAEQAALTARAQALAENLTRADRAHARLAAEHDQIRRERAAVIPPDPAALAQTRDAREAAERDLAEAAIALEHAEAARAASLTRHQEARARLHQAEPARARLAAEIDALAEVLAAHHGSSAPLIDTLSVPEGLEAAIGGALADLLDLSSDAASPSHVRALPPLPAPPAPPGTTALGLQIAAPPELDRALSHTFLTVDGATPDPASLGPGQVVVTPRGGVQRWDGFVRKDGAPSPAAVRLTQRNKLTALRQAIAGADAALAGARREAAEAGEAERAATTAETQARAARRDAGAALDRAREAEAKLRRRADEATARLAVLDAQASRLGQSLEAAAAERAAAQAAHAALPDANAAAARRDAAQASLAETRRQEQEAAAAHAALTAEAATCAARLAAIGPEREAWQSRAQDAAIRDAELAARIAEAEAVLATQEAAPARLDQVVADARDARDGAEARHRATATLLREAEHAADTAQRADREADHARATARETALRAEGDARAADMAWGTIAERVIERLGANPDIAIPEDLSPEAEDRARRRAERLTREREEMGPVNLRAELEVQEIEARIAAVDRERNELTEAIHKLRGSIGHLNREGRERLNKVFADIDTHFRHLFTRMFGGGRAHLALVGSDDPLLAGLEIYAEPPGKKLATLSLLSGGEQALTALSLIFAVFRCNPAPICVLDEVDAPLDDANIERFCNLLSDMVTETGTRFLVITHHHMTMARMDRLHGVTMQERGVSRLLSVDLQKATELTPQFQVAAE